MKTTTADGTIWQALAPADIVTDYTNAAELAHDTDQGEDTAPAAYIHNGGPLFTIDEQIVLDLR